VESLLFLIAGYQTSKSTGIKITTPTYIKKNDFAAFLAEIPNIKTANECGKQVVPIWHQETEMVRRIS